MAFPLPKPWALPNLIKTRGSLVLYRSPECIGYAELEQAWKYMTVCCVSFDPCRSISEHIWPYHKNGTQCHHLNKFGSIWRTRCSIPSFNVIGLLVPKEDLFEGFYHMWAWKQFWSCDPEHLNKHFHLNIPWRLHSKFGFKRPKCCLSKWSLKMSNLSVSEWQWPWVVMYSYIWL